MAYRAPLTLAATLLMVITIINHFSEAHPVGSQLPDLLPPNDIVTQTSELDNSPKTKVSVVGQVICFTPTWVPRSKPLLAGIDVIYWCEDGGGRTTVSQTVVDPDGTVWLLFDSAQFITSGYSPVGRCWPALRTPVAGCAVRGVSAGDLPDLIGNRNGHHAGDDHTQYVGHTYDHRYP